MKTFSIIIISFIFFSALVRAQSETAANPAAAASPASTSAPDHISQCIQANGCTYSDLNCVAWCAGVPNPSPQDVNATNDCVSNCPNTTTEGYQSCVSGCINSHYNQPTAYKTSTVASPMQTGIATPLGTVASPSTSATATSTNKSPSTPSPISAVPSLNQFKTNLYLALFLAILVAVIL